MMPPATNSDPWSPEQHRRAERALADLERIARRLAELSAALAAGARWGQDARGWHLTRLGRIVWPPEAP